MKKTKIICTMGPNTDDEEMMRKLVKAGMDVADSIFLTEIMKDRKSEWIC